MEPVQLSVQQLKDLTEYINSPQFMQNRMGNLPVKVQRMGLDISPDASQEQAIEILKIVVGSASDAKRLNDFFLISCLSAKSDRKSQSRAAGRWVTFKKRNTQEEIDAIPNLVRELLTKIYENKETHQ